MKYCKVCVMPNTRPDTPFSDEGVCAACQHLDFESSDIDWNARAKEFDELIKQHKTKDYYDCLIPVSGGKDSTYQVHKALELGLVPLCVCFETTLPTEIGKKNLDTMRDLGVDLIHIRADRNLYKKMTYYGFKNMGNAQWPLFLGVYCAPIQTAIRFNIPLVIWGENAQALYGGQVQDRIKSQLDRYWVEHLGGLHNKTASSLLDEEGINPKQLSLYRYPEDEQINKLGLKSVFLSYYFKWEQHKQLARIKDLGWEPADRHTENSFTNYAGIDCHALQVHSYLKYVKFGFGRATDDAAIAVREGRISRDEAIRLVQRYDGKPPQEAGKLFANYLDISMDEYNAILDSFTNRDIFDTDSQGKLKRDLDGSLVKRKEFELN